MTAVLEGLTVQLEYFNGARHAPQKFIYVKFKYVLLFSDHLLGIGIKKRYTSRPVGATPSLCVRESRKYIRIKLCLVNI